MKKTNNDYKTHSLPADTPDLSIRQSGNSRPGRHSPTISLCMIVKDEEEFLPRCLESVRDYVDEIIIVDTGSTDNTVKIAKKYNAKIYHHPWENSFSKARNYSLKYATCDWILILDADEEIDNEDACKLREIIKEEDSNAFSLPVFNKPMGGKSVSVFNSPRIFKNHLGFHYEGIVHNRMKYTGATKTVNIRLYHYGYNLDDEQKEEKFIRSSTLLKEQIRNGPHNPLPHHYLAVAYLNREKYDECIREVLEAIDLFERQNSDATITLITYYTASVAFYRKDDLCKAEIYALKALDIYPDYLDAFCILSSVYLRQKEYSKCVAVTEKYLRLLKSVKSNPVTALTIPYNLQGSLGALSRLAILNFEQNKEHEGIKALKRAINSADYKWEPYLAIGEYFLGQKNLNLAERFLKEGHKYSTDNKEVLFKLGRLYYLRNDLKKAEALYKKVLEIDADHIDVLKGMGTLCLDTKRFEEARIFLYKALRKVKDIEIYNNLGCLEDKECLYERSIYFFRKALELDPENQVIMGNIKNIQNKLVKERKSEEYSKPKDGSISLCMIVKDEEHNLGRCLTSVKGVVDEIIVVDTGSTDRTVEIARSFGAKVFYHPWEGSFSKARNYSLKYATSEWILYLDADEELSKGDVPLLLDVVKNSNYTTVSFAIKNKFKNSTQESYASMIRLFKNYNGIYYDGIVHNNIKYNGKLFGSSISIIHHGYNLSDDQMDEKFLRTTTLLKKQINSDEHNPVPHMYLGSAYMGKGLYDDAIAESKCALMLVDGISFLERDFIVSYYVISAAYFEKGEFSESEKYARKAIEIDCRFIDGFCILTLIYYNLKKYDKFLENSKRYLTLWDTITTQPAKGTNFICHTLGYLWKVRLIRGFYYLSTGQDETGNIEIDIALKNSTAMEECLKLLGNFYMENNFTDKAEDTYRKLLSIDGTSINALIKMGYIKYKEGSIKDSMLFWRKAIDIEPALFDIRLLICKINITMGNFEDVIADCGKLLHVLNMPGNIELGDYSDLANIFNMICEKLEENQDTQAARTAFNICEDVKRVQSMQSCS